jgi:hypothetical protein
MEPYSKGVGAIQNSAVVPSGSCRKERLKLRAVLWDTLMPDVELHQTGFFWNDQCEYPNARFAILVTASFGQT